MVCALDRRGKVAFRETVECRREALVAFARTRLRKTDRLAVEATTNTRAVADIPRPFVAAVTVGKPDVVRGKLADCRRKAPGRAKAAGSDLSLIHI